MPDNENIYHLGNSKHLTPYHIIYVYLMLNNFGITQCVIII